MQTKISSDKKEVIIGHDQPVVAIGERINPTGRSKLARALEQGDFKYVQDEALKQVAAGGQVLGINVGVSGTDEKALMVDVIHAVREVTDPPPLFGFSQT